MPRGTATVALSMSISNVFGYALTVALSRLLGPVQYGALGALMVLVLVGSVPGLALQQVAARRSALALHKNSNVGRPMVESQTLVDAILLSLLTFAVGAVLTVPLTLFLHLSSVSSLALATVSLLPVALTAGIQGVLQGARRFGALAFLFIAAALLRLVTAVGAAGAGWGLDGVVAGTALGGAVAVGIGLALVRFDGWPMHRNGSTLRRQIAALGEVLAVVPVVGGLLVIANMDVLLARHYLSPVEAGTYAVGSIVTRVAFWAPQFIGVLAFSHFADVNRRTAALRKAVCVIVAVGTCGVAAALTFAGPLVKLVLGPDYASLAPLTWVFALLGSSLALGQLLMTAGVAARQRGLALRIWTCLAVQVIAVGMWHSSVRQIALVSVACTSGLIALAIRNHPGLLPSSRMRAPESPVA